MLSMEPVELVDQLPAVSKPSLSSFFQQGKQTQTHSYFNEVFIA